MCKSIVNVHANLMYSDENAKLSDTYFLRTQQMRRCDFFTPQRVVFGELPASNN